MQAAAISAAHVFRRVPLDAAKHKVAGTLFGADCYSCARCLNVCPQEAIAYRWVLGGSAPGNAAAAPGPEKAALHGDA